MCKENEVENCDDEVEHNEVEHNEVDMCEVWAISLDKLSEIENAFESDKQIKLNGKTILDVGTDCVTPLYISLKFEPEKIIGIDEELNSFAPAIEQRSKLFAGKIRFYECSLFNKNKIDKILKKERIERFDFVLVSKTLHHLRTGICIKEHKCRMDEKCCKYEFEDQKIFKRLLELGKRVIIYECFFPQEKDDDKERGRGEYFTTEEWEKIFKNLLEKYKVELVSPKRCNLDIEKRGYMSKIFREVDCICFYIEENISQANMLRP